MHICIHSRRRYYGVKSPGGTCVHSKMQYRFDTTTGVAANTVSSALATCCHHHMQSSQDVHRKSTMPPALQLLLLLLDTDAHMLSLPRSRPHTNGLLPAGPAAAAAAAGVHAAAVTRAAPSFQAMPPLAARCCRVQQQCWITQQSLFQVHTTGCRVATRTARCRPFPQIELAEKMFSRTILRETWQEGERCTQISVELV